MSWSWLNNSFKDKYDVDEDILEAKETYPHASFESYMEYIRKRDEMIHNQTKKLVCGGGKSEKEDKYMYSFKQYRRKQIAEFRPVSPEETLSSLINAKVSVSVTDVQDGSPKSGDMIARNLKNHEDQWLVAAQYFKDNFETIE